MIQPETRIRAATCVAGMALALLAACGRSGADSAVPAGAEGVQRVGAEAARTAAVTNPPAEMPALNSQVLADLAADTPEFKARLPELEAGERAALKQVMDAARARLAPAAAPTARLPAPAPRRAVPAARPAAGGIPVLDWFIPPAAAAEGGLDWGSLQTLGVGYMFTAFLGSAGDAGHGEPGTEAMRSEYSGKNGEKASIVVKTEKDSQVTSEISTEIAVPLFLMEANSKVAITSRGLCPDVNGNVDFTIRFSTGGHKDGGKNTAYDRTREAHVKATVNDDAEIANADIDTKYGDRSTAGGRQVYVEGATSWNTTRSDASTMQVTRHELVRASSQAGPEDQHLVEDGAKHALLLGQAALLGAKAHWQGGACIRINAKSPGVVKRRAVTPIAVSVVHRLDGSDVAARVKAGLTGGESVSPALIPRTPGTLTHTAPDAKVAQMSIKLSARSKRGMAEETLKLLINEGAYNAEGGAGDFHGTGLICSLAAPFEISGSGVTVKFTPASEQGGTYTYDGSMAGFHLYGQGTFKVIYKDDVPVEIFATGPGNVDSARGAGDEHYKLTPAQDYHCDDKLMQPSASSS